MNNNTRRIVVLDNLDSLRIEQAIFILRDNTEENECDAVSEAQRIVNNYMLTMSGEKSHTLNKKSKSRFLFGMSLYTLATVLLTTFIMNMAK